MSWYRITGVFGAGVATLSFGFKITEPRVSAGVVATALTFGLVLMVLVYGIGSISGCHINPVVTMGFLTARRIGIRQAGGYWIAQLLGGIVGRAASTRSFTCRLATDRAGGWGRMATGRRR